MKPLFVAQTSSQGGTHKAQWSAGQVYLGIASKGHVQR
jgi:hypothetical protein